MIPFMRAVGLSTAVALYLSGCMRVGPDYKKPQLKLQDTWSTRLASEVSDPNLLEQWWTAFEDPILCQLIEKAKADNLDLQQAIARVKEARSQLLIAKGRLWPTVGLSSSVTRRRVEADQMDGMTSSLYSAGLDASWELDLFGGKHRAIEAASASLQATEASLQDVLVSLLAEVALNYIEVRLNQQLLSITESNLQTRQETFRIASWRCQAGLTTELDVEQARLSLEQARAQVPAIQTSLRQAIYRLAVLLGDNPCSLDQVLAVARPVPAVPSCVAITLPADLLRRRPDIRAAERNLAAQTAQIGVAKDALYPGLGIMAGLSLDSVSIADLLDGTRTIQGLINSAWTVFDARVTKQNVEIQEARRQQALAQYQATVLAALRDVEAALVAYANEQLRTRSLAEALGSANKAFELAIDQYNSGLVSFQTVLDTQQTLLSIQDQLARSSAGTISNLIRLYKALGGGWSGYGIGKGDQEDL